MLFYRTPLHKGGWVWGYSVRPIADDVRDGLASRFKSCMRAATIHALVAHLDNQRPQPGLLSREDLLDVTARAERRLEVRVAVPDALLGQAAQVLQYAQAYLGKWATPAHAGDGVSDRPPAPDRDPFPQQLAAVAHVTVAHQQLPHAPTPPPLAQRVVVHTAGCPHAPAAGERALPALPAHTAAGDAGGDAAAPLGDGDAAPRDVSRRRSAESGGSGAEAPAAAAVTAAAAAAETERCRELLRGVAQEPPDMRAVEPQFEPQGEYDQRGELGASAHGRGGVGGADGAGLVDPPPVTHVRWVAEVRGWHRVASMEWQPDAMAEMAPPDAAAPTPDEREMKQQSGGPRLRFLLWIDAGAKELERTHPTHAVCGEFEKACDTVRDVVHGCVHAVICEAAIELQLFPAPSVGAGGPVLRFSTDGWRIAKHLCQYTHKQQQQHEARLFSAKAKKPAHRLQPVVLSNAAPHRDDAADCTVVAAAGAPAAAAEPPGQLLADVPDFAADTLRFYRHYL
eukprot:gene33373-17583_t